MPVVAQHPPCLLRPPQQFPAAFTNVGITGQTATFAEGTIPYEVDYSPTQQTATFTEGTIAPEADYFPGAQTGVFAEGLISITGQDTGLPSKAGGTGSSRRKRIKRASEVFAEEMAKLERQAAAATAKRVEVEAKLLEPVSDSMLGYIADFERALKRAQAIERRQAEAVEVPVYFRLPAKSEGVKRVEAYERLRSLAKIARYRESVAAERLRKVKERIDEEAATYFMNFIMWDD